MTIKKDAKIEAKIRDRFCSEVKDEWLYNRNAVVEGRLCKEACEEIERLRKIESKFSELQHSIWKADKGMIDSVIRDLGQVEVNFPSVALDFESIMPSKPMNSFPTKMGPELTALSELYKVVAVETEERARTAVTNYEAKTEESREALINTLKRFKEALKEAGVRYPF
tara:strand:+ start:10686 stop:11189 length:504 start_codon:yes stop_codon:yes gene_type:complete